MHPGLSPDNAPEGPAHGAPCLGRALHFLRKYTGPESGSQYSDFTKSSRTFLLFSQRLLQSESDKIHRARAAEHKIQRTHTVLWVKPCRGSRALSTGTGPAATGRPPSSRWETSITPRPLPHSRSVMRRSWPLNAKSPCCCRCACWRCTGPAVLPGLYRFV